MKHRRDCRRGRACGVRGGGGGGGGPCGVRGRGACVGRAGGRRFGWTWIGNYDGVRRLTPTECERLQGFPDGWTTGQADSTRYRQLGNAVAVPCAEWIGKYMME